MQNELVVFIAFILLAIFFQVLAFKNINEKYKNQKFKIFMMGAFVKKELFNKKGWFFRNLAIVIFIIGFLF